MSTRSHSNSKEFSFRKSSPALVRIAQECGIALRSPKRVSAYVQEPG